MIESGERRQKISQERFASIARHSTRISIIHRYAGKNMVERAFRGGDCGLLFFLNEISADTRDRCLPKSVSIYVSEIGCIDDQLIKCIRSILT